jgi:hypothetical protein
MYAFRTSKEGKNYEEMVEPPALHVEPDACLTIAFLGKSNLVKLFI